MWSIRKAGLSDATLLAQLNAAVQQVHVENKPNVFKPAVATEELVRWIVDRLASHTFDAYIGELDSEAIGYVVTEKTYRPETPFTYAAQSLLIDQMSVSPEHRSKGYGEKLIEYVRMVAQQQGFHKVALSVWGFNVRAQMLYERCGFTVRDMRYEKALV